MSAGAGEKVRMLALFEKLSRLPTPGGCVDDLESQQFTKWEIAFLVACFEEATGLEFGEVRYGR